MSLFQELGKHLENVKSWNPQQAKTEEVFSYIDLSSVDKDRKALDINQIQQVTSSNAPSRARQIVKKSDILVSTVRPNLNGVAFVPDDLDNATASTGYCVLRANEKTLSAQYLFYWVQTKSFINEMVSKASGANYPAVSDKIIKQSKIPLPPLVEQQKIAAILDAADSLRQKDQQLVERYTALSQSLFLEMFGDLTSEKKFSFFQTSELIDVRDGTHDSPSYVDDGIPLVTSKNIKNGELDLSDVNLISKEDYLQIQKRSGVDIGDIIMPMIGTIGNPHLVKLIPNYAIKNVALYKYPEPSNINNIYLYYILNGYYFDRYVGSKNKGGTQKFLSLGDLRKMPFPMPPIELQNQFAERIQLIEEQKQQAKRSLEKSEALFNSLLQRAFTGELTAKIAA